tara:strand:- start:56 stop:205 length:150 start_codon:yes stop_codon:yes gene_type:complete
MMPSVGFVSEYHRALGGLSDATDHLDQFSLAVAIDAGDTDYLSSGHLKI